MKEEVDKEQEELDRHLKMIVELSRTEQFQVWRDEVVTPIISQIEAELASNQADEMPESILRAKIKHLNSLKYLFNQVFEVAKMNIKNNK